MILNTTLHQMYNVKYNVVQQPMLYNIFNTHQQYYSSEPF